MFNAWFVIKNDYLYDEDNLRNTPWSNCGNLWGRKLGGRWCLDYYFKLYFNLSTEYWETKVRNIKTDSELYELFDNLGIAYRRIDDNLIHYKGKLYNEKGRIL